MLFSFLEFPLHEQLLFVYFVLLNIITFFVFGLDKYKSSGNFRRTPEKTLWTLSLFGGSIGALLAMHFFRHKTKKTSFQSVLFLILCIQAFVIFTFLSYAFK